jgi:hypothetical protein
VHKNEGEDLGYVLFSVIAIGPNVRGFKHGQVDGFLRAIKIRSTTSFGGEIKLDASYRKILRHEQDHLQV